MGKSKTKHTNAEDLISYDSLPTSILASIFLSIFRVSWVKL